MRTMRTRITLITVAVAVLVVAVGVAVAAQSDDGNPATRLSLADNGAVVALDEDGTLILELEANPTTGFTWELDTLDEGVLRLVGEPAYRSDSDLPGSPGTMTFTFEAAGPGETELRMVYHRPWEDASPTQAFGLSITVG